MTDTVGQLLRATREAKGQTLEDVERVIRIRGKHLAALEADHFAALPSAAHARGFLKNYAQHLGLDPAAVLAAYDAQVQKRSLLSLRPPPKPAPPLVQAPRRPPPPARPNPANRASPATPPRGAPGTGGAGKPLQPADPARAARGARPVPGRTPTVTVRRLRFLSADVLVAVVITLVLVGLLAWGGTQLATGMGTAPTATLGFLAGLSTASPAELTAAALATPTERPTATSTALPPTPAVAYSGVNVTVSAELRAWVSVKVDGVEAFAGIMPPGETRDFVGLSVVEVTTGNGQGTRVVFNGVDQGLLGELGEVVIRLWTETGMLTPTPTVAPTATLEG